MIMIHKVLRRGDAASVVVAVVLGMALAQFTQALAGNLSGPLSGLNDGQYYTMSPPGVGWRGEYLQPLVALALELIVLEALLWIYVFSIAPIYKTSGESRDPAKKP